MPPPTGGLGPTTAFVSAAPSALATAGPPAAVAGAGPGRVSLAGAAPAGGVAPPSALVGAVNLLSTPVSAVDLDRPAPVPHIPDEARATASPHANAPASFFCATVAAFPATPQLLTKSKLPMGLIMAPFRTQAEDEVHAYRHSDTRTHAHASVPTYTLHPHIEAQDV
jgi:hypothetical protein